MFSVSATLDYNPALSDGQERQPRNFLAEQQFGKARPLICSMKAHAPSRSIHRARARLIFFLFIGAAVPFAPSTGQTRSSRTRPAAKEPSVTTETSPAPFRIGEKLTYRIAWANFSSAATVQLAVAERRDLHGWDTWHLRAQAHTLSPVRDTGDHDADDKI